MLVISLQYRYVISSNIFAGEDAGEVCGCASALPAEDHRTGSSGAHGFFLVKGMGLSENVGLIFPMK